ncbi:alpha/beta hydrolase [Sphingomonas koreensis]|jgi:pimeloyl-ACP methyl ester carboxylesterase|uniref:Alpha/beta hydrolase n=1 Tax=Sphingomonas koreensis TaxID=93064 RepID=A0A1L6J9D0_9SPHN|nr:alpha/beta hydrolase [Sphingomonas koreensis]APR52515.1 alpha/beta hydrolase [Sphingomonas koreensis]MDC7811692.1 alpha/beta hydrolase [Sphingomonas koreensis]RSU18003.1 alpha/beta hydrolase [Sphingomonas koreensis]RSU22169.1 alpha/beta hydrolase [Sphingomonas koreensis]RSU23821.1 alpha/beta hydrolase [Sphingomonas koreensis]
MAGFELQRIALSTGVELDVATAGDPAAPAIVLLHGFPESHRTWRHQIPELAKTHFVIAPDQRGFARSSKPEGAENYTPDKTVGDLIALADHFGKDRFVLVGHDWGGAIAWMAALQHPNRVERLIIVNAPHPFVFQKSLFDDMEQRAASQYIRLFRNPGLEAQLEAMGLGTFFDTTFARHADPALLAPERDAYLDEWSQPGAMTAMLNWYRASAIVVPGMDETPERPAFLDGPFPSLQMPVLVIWGMGDTALLPVQLEGLGQLVPDLKIVKVDAGHFVPWENPAAVNATIRDWLP